MSGRHVDPKSRRGDTPSRSVLPVLTVLLVCLATAIVVTVGVRQKASQATADGSLGLTSQQPLVAPLTKKARALRGQAADHQDVVVRSQTARGEAAKTADKPAEVVSGEVVRRKTPAEIAASIQRAAEREAARQTFTVNIGTFNVLGSQHTTPSGDHRKFPSAGWRNGAAYGLIRAHGADIIGLQEAQPDQLNALQSMTGYAAYPGYQFGANETDNSILYNTAKYEFVSGSSFTIHFMHANRPQTILRLRDKASGREFYVLNMHASAGFGGFAVTRRAGHYTAAATVNNLKSEGLPIFLTGDMNDRAEFFCRVAPITGMVASIGGNVAGGCHPAGALAVDWVMGWGNVKLRSNQWEDRSAVTRKISDHFFVTATATVGPFSS